MPLARARPEGQAGLHFEAIDLRGIHHSRESALELEHAQTPGGRRARGEIEMDVCQASQSASAAIEDGGQIQFYSAAPVGARGRQHIGQQGLRIGRELNPGPVHDQGQIDVGAGPRRSGKAARTVERDPDNRLMKRQSARHQKSMGFGWQGRRGRHLRAERENGFHGEVECSRRRCGGGAL